MGYTHYWEFTNIPKEIKDGQDKFKKAVSLFKKGLKKIPDEIDVELYNWKKEKYETFKQPFKLAGGNGQGEPIINDEVVCFNGVWGDEDMSHETFYIGLECDRDYLSDFCKTARKPYDVAVCLALLCFKDAFGKDFSYSSDGDDDDEGWKLAHQIFNKIK